MDSLSRCLLLPVACGIVAVVSNCLAADLVVSSDTTVDAAHPLNNQPYSVQVVRGV